MINDYQVIVAGVARMLAPFPDRVEVAELDTNTPPRRRVHVALLDTFAAGHTVASDVTALEQSGRAERVVAYTWVTDATAINRAMSAGAAGYLPKSLAADDLVDAIERIATGETLVWPARGKHRGPAEWPGRQFGLTERESEIMALITQGKTNVEIKDALFLSINTIKSYVRSAYRKVGVSTRVEAVLWGVEHGFLPQQSSIPAGRQGYFALGRAGPTDPNSGA